MAGLIAEDDRRLSNGSPSIRAVPRMLAEAWNRDRALVWTGTAGLILGFSELVVLVANGRFIPPEGDLTKPIAFNLASGIYLLTMALLVPLAGFSAQGHRQWCRWQVALALGAFAIENIQVYRGLDPRYASIGTLVNRLLGCAFVLIGFGIIAVFLVFVMRLVQRRRAAGAALLLLGVRYACLGTMSAFGAGVWMSVVKGLQIGIPLDLMPVHALGFHSLQAIPITALLLEWGSLPAAAARRWVHVAGSAWLGACAALTWQALQERSILELSPAPVITAVCLLLWGSVLTVAVRAWWKTNPARSHAPSRDGAVQGIH